jgi:hypothetical protein
MLRKTITNLTQQQYDTNQEPHEQHHQKMPFSFDALFNLPGFRCPEQPEHKREGTGCYGQYAFDWRFC